MDALGLGSCTADELFTAVMGKHRVAARAAPAVQGGVRRGHGNGGCFTGPPRTAGDGRGHRDPVPKSHGKRTEVALAGGHAGLEKGRTLNLAYYGFCFHDPTGVHSLIALLEITRTAVMCAVANLARNTGPCLQQGREKAEEERCLHGAGDGAGLCCEPGVSDSGKVLARG